MADSEIQIPEQQLIDWSMVKVKASKDGFELHLPNMETGRLIVSKITEGVAPNLKSLMEERFKKPELLEDWRLDGNQMTCQENVEQIEGKPTNVLYLFVKNNDTDAEQKLNTVFKSMLPEKFEVEEN